ncbi:MAG TPA: VWA domain-containing protein [Actinomycetota bacterium]|nr:VWA domain-containing protein [Actinomycetota bacterium]
MNTNAPPRDGPPEASFARALLRFIHRLRDAGIPVSMVETLDAAECLARIDVTNRSELRAALGASLVKRSEHLAAFESLFDIYFAVHRDQPQMEVSTSLDRTGGDGRGERSGTDDKPEQPPSTDLLKALLEALRSDDQAALRALAALAVDQFGGINAERVASERYYLYRILRQLELSELLRQAILREREEAEIRTALGDRLTRDELTRRVEEFRKLISQEVRWRLAQSQGASQAADVFHDRPIEDVDFLSASPAELRQMREAIRPLAQKLAARIARRRRFRRHGRLDVRRTMRRSLSAGGVPLDPSFRYPRASKPDLYLLCDISGSVSEFARFTMSLLYAMKEEFSRIRLFAFVDGIDEVTDRFDATSNWLAPRNLLYHTDVISGDGHSDYGNVFQRFWHQYGYADLDPRSTVIITGDARNNYRPSGTGTLRLINERARKVFWLNPESRREWNTTDSIIDAYLPSCHGVFEARNLTQLADFVYAIT